MSTTQITGEALVMVGRHTRFDPAEPGNTKAHEFAFVDTNVAENFTGSWWAQEGYVIAGRATITIDLLPAKEMAAGAIESLKAQKAKVLADAHAAATKIEQEIQSLLALPFNGSEGA